MSKKLCCSKCGTKILKATGEHRRMELNIKPGLSISYSVNGLVTDDEPEGERSLCTKCFMEEWFNILMATLED